MRRLDAEITAGIEFANAQVAPGAENYPGGPWADDIELTEHFEKYERSGLFKVSHWSPTDFDYAPGRPQDYEFYVDGHRIVADFWRLWEPGHTKPIECELYAPPESLTSPQLMSKILRESAFIVGSVSADEIPLPCPCDMPLDPALVTVVGREFAFAWFRKRV